MAETSFRITDLETGYIISGLYHLRQAIQSHAHSTRDRDINAIDVLLKKLVLPLTIEPETLHRLGIRNFVGNA